MNYNAVLVKKDGSYIPIRHDFDTYNAFLRNYMQDYDDALSSGKYQIVVGDLVIDVEDVSHIQPIYEEDEKEEQGGAKGMQLFGEGFMVEGDPYELAVFAKNLGADEIRMSDVYRKDETDCCGGCDCDSDDEITVNDKGITISDSKGENVLSLDSNGILKVTASNSKQDVEMSPFVWNGVDSILNKVQERKVIVMQIPFGDNFEERSSNLVKHVQSQYGNDIKVVVLPSDVQVIDANL